jgi:NAD(P)-dependent dehydrogenase (short-subunit alcohol dehydrogenase family)
MLLKDKVVIVSGVGPGMGQALARIAASEGASVVLAARNKAFLDEVSADIVAKGGKAIAVPCDVSDEAQCKALADRAGEEFGGRVHGLVNRKTSQRRSTSIALGRCA